MTIEVVFFFQAEDGIRDLTVTGVQTCAPPISPDWCILDLDPKDAPFTDVVTVAKAVHALCDDIGLPTGIKTSGSTGLHVLIPLGRQVTYEQSRTLGGLLARALAAALPQIATATRAGQKRGGKVYLDYVQNGHGRLLVAPVNA